MTMPEKELKDKGKGNDADFIPPGQKKVKKQQEDLMYMLLKKGGNGGGNSGGNSGNSGNSSEKSNNGKNNSDKSNGNSKSNKDKSSDRVKNKDLTKEERQAKKDKIKANKGYRQKGKYNNKGKHLGWYKNGKIAEMLQPGEKVDVTYYLNDVSEPLAQVLMTYNEEGNYNAAYNYGLERISVEAVDETRPEAQDPLYYLYDGLGSVTFMVKPDGNKRDHYRYDAFGKPAPGNSKLSEDGRIVNHNTFGYTGEMWDQEAELLYLRARYYEPETGRFLSRDTYEGTLKNPLSRNLYAYVGNNPVNYVDPTGQVKLYINGKLVQGVTVRDGISYMDATILASKFGLQARHERDRFGPTNLWTIMNRNWSEFSHYTSSDGKIPIRDFAEDWGIAIFYNEVQNAIYLGTQPKKITQGTTIWDEVTIRRIKKLHPLIREDVREFILEAQKEGIYLRITTGLRTFEEQDKLYQKGRTVKGKIVTNAEAGESYHNYGLAFDVVEIKDGKAVWNTKNWSRIGELGKKHGFKWGGDFKSILDKPHFEKTFGFHHSELLKMYNAGNVDNAGNVRIK